MFPRFLIYLFFSLASITAYADNIELPDIGDNAGIISPVEEYRTGEAVIRNIRRAGGVLDDSLIQDYLNEIGYRLVAHSETDQPFHFFLIKDSSINAFALPGGFIGINAGLIMATRSESELAGVMAHEIAHITQRHHARQYEQSSGNIPLIAALIAAMVLGSQDNDIGQAAVASVAAGQVQKQINFTRANEKEADRLGIKILIGADFNPHSMADFFDTMDKQSRLYGDNIPEFLRTHPVNPARIADAKQRAQQYQNRLETDSDKYYLLRARLFVLASEDINKTEKELASKLKLGNYENKNATRYGYALALMLNKNYKEALQQANILIKENNGVIAYHILKAQIETAALLYSEAINTFQQLLKIYPGNKTINLYYAETLLSANKISHANQVLENIAKTDTNTPQVYQLLAKTQSKLNKPAYSHQSLAEYYYLLGQTHDAIKQIEIALALPKVDFYLVNKLEARMKEFKDELQQLSANE